MDFNFICMVLNVLSPEKISPLSSALYFYLLDKRTPSLTSPKFPFQSSHPNKPCHSTKHLTGHGRNLRVIFSFYLFYSPHQIHHQILIILPPKCIEICLRILFSLSYPSPSPIFHQDCCNSLIYWFLLASITSLSSFLACLSPTTSPYPTNTQGNFLKPKIGSCHCHT